MIKKQGVISGEELNLRLRNLGITRTAFGKFFRKTKATVNGWAYGVAPITEAVEKKLHQLELIFDWLTDAPRPYVGKRAKEDAEQAVEDAGYNEEEELQK